MVGGGVCVDQVATIPAGDRLGVGHVHCVSLVSQVQGVLLVRGEELDIHMAAKTDVGVVVGRAATDGQAVQGIQTRARILDLNMDGCRAVGRPGQVHGLRAASQEGQCLVRRGARQHDRGAVRAAFHREGVRGRRQLDSVVAKAGGGVVVVCVPRLGRAGNGQCVPAIRSAVNGLGCPGREGDGHVPHGLHCVRRGRRDRNGARTGARARDNGEQAERGGVGTGELRRELCGGKIEVRHGQAHEKPERPTVCLSLACGLAWGRGLACKGAEVLSAG